MLNLICFAGWAPPLVRLARFPDGLEKALANFKYVQLADHLRNEIALSLLTPGQQIPTEETLADRFSLSRNTVRQAIKVLIDEGYLVSLRGSGTFVSKTLDPQQRTPGTAGRKCVAVVMSHVSNYIFPRVLMGISEYLSERGYSLIIRITFNHIAKEEQILREVLASQVDGLIIEPARAAWPRVNYDLYRQIEQKMPCVLTHSVLSGFKFASVGVSDVEGVALLVDHFVANGHSNIAAICKSDEQTGVNRFLGYATGLRRNGLVLDEKRVLWYVDDEFEELFSDANAHRVFSVMRQCTAVICFNDELVSRFYLFLERHDLKVPENISIAGFDDSIERKDIRPLTTIEHPKEGLGRAAAKALLTLIENPAADASFRFEPKLIARETVKNLRG